MLFSVQRFVEDYFNNRGWTDPDQYAVKIANEFCSAGSTTERARRIARIRTIFFTANREVDRKQLEGDLFEALEGRFKKKLDPGIAAVVRALPAQRRALAGARLTVDVVVDAFAHFAEQQLVDLFWKSRTAGTLRSRPETIGQGLLAAYLKGTFGEHSCLLRELKSGIGFVDIALIRGGKKYLIEVKVEKSRVFTGIAQLDSYMTTEQCSKGWLVVFNASPPAKKLILPNQVTVSAGNARVIGIDINPAVPSKRRTK